MYPVNIVQNSNSKKDPKVQKILFYMYISFTISSANAVKGYSINLVKFIRYDSPSCTLKIILNSLAASVPIVFSYLYAKLNSMMFDTNLKKLLALNHLNPNRNKKNLRF